MEAGEMEEVLRVVDSSLSRITWRLRSSARRRLHTDILALCTGVRPVVMVDYGGKMPELKEHLFSLMHFCHEDSSILKHLEIMVIQDMIYLIHVKGLVELASNTSNSLSELLFVDLDQDPPKMLPFGEENLLVSVQKLFLSVLHVDEVSENVSLGLPPLSTPSLEKSTYRHNDPSCAPETISHHYKPIDLSSCIEDTNVTIPTLNGWLLGYPAVYLFSKEHIDDAVYNLSTKPLRLYKVVVCRRMVSGKTSEEELMSFSVPCDLSMGGREEPWAEAFLARLARKLESCGGVWSSMRLDVAECYPQAIVL